MPVPAGVLIPVIVSAGQSTQRVVIGPITFDPARLSPVVHRPPMVPVKLCRVFPARRKMPVVHVPEHQTKFNEADR